MLETIVTIFGLPALFLIMLSKGLLIGKIIPTSIVIPTYVLLNNITTLNSILLFTTITALGTLIGQYIIYKVCYGKDPIIVTQLPYVSISTSKIEKSQSLFDKYGGVSILITNVTPGLRSVVSIPAGLTKYPTHRFILLSYISTVLYHTAYALAAVLGIELLL